MENEEFKKEMETLGCKVNISDDEVNIVCPMSAIEKGIRIPSRWEIKNANVEDNNLKLVFKKE